MGTEAIKQACYELYEDEYEVGKRGGGWGVGGQTGQRSERGGGGGRLWGQRPSSGHAMSWR